MSYSPVWLMAESVTRLELYPLCHLANNSNALVNVTLTASAFSLTVGFLVTFVRFYATGLQFVFIFLLHVFVFQHVLFMHLQQFVDVIAHKSPPLVGLNFSLI